MLVGVVEVEPVRHPRGRGAGRVLLVAVPGGLDDAEGSSLDGDDEKASYIGVARSSNRPSGRMPMISSIERMTERKS